MNGVSPFARTGTVGEHVYDIDYRAADIKDIGTPESLSYGFPEAEQSEFRCTPAELLQGLRRA